MKYYIIAGEASGDLHASNLIKEIIKLEPNADIRAWGGDKMQNAGANVVKHFKDLAFMGFYEVLINLRTILKNISFNWNTRSVIGLVGANGSGKTTLGKAILGANKISEGQVIFHDDNIDYDLANINKKELREYRNRLCYDGDTCYVVAKTLPDTLRNMSIRILGIDTPEIRGKCLDEKNHPYNPLITLYH